MKKTILVFCLILIAICAFTQTPDWQWATQTGGSGNDFSYGIAIDDNGNIFVAGEFEGTVTFGSYSLTSSGFMDIFVAKMDATGNWLWATKAGGSSYDGGFGIAIDDNDNIYVTGAFDGTATFGSYSLTNSGLGDIFVAKMDATGNWLWATKAGGSSYDGGNGIAIDDNGNSYVIGTFEGIATFGSYSLTSSGSSDNFVAKIDAAGNWLWATKAGGYGYDCGWGIAIDDIGNSYVTGWFENTATFGSHSLTSSGSSDNFVGKMDSAGNWLWATKAGGNGSDFGYGIAIDYYGNCCITGSFMETATFGSYSLTSNGGSDIFSAKIDATGNWLRAIQVGGSSDDCGIGIVLDENGNSYVTGSFSETATFGSYSLTSGGEWDIFVAKMDATGNWLWAIQAEGNGFDVGYNIAIDGNGNSYVIGTFEGTTTFSPYSLISGGGIDFFVAKLGNDTSIENGIIQTKVDLSNYPNPFNPSTTIYFETTNLNESEQIEIYNVKGQRINQLEIRNVKSGMNEVVWNGVDELGKPVSSGIYFYKLKVNGKDKAIKKMLLLK